MTKGSVAVLGIGNILLTDDGVGVHTVNAMQRMIEFNNTAVIDGGTAIFDLVDVFIKHKKVIIVDSIRGGHAPGTLYRLTPGDLGALIRENSSLHEVQVIDIVGLVKHMGYEPEVVILGVEPQDIGYSLELSPGIKKVVPLLIQEIKKELEIETN